MIKVLKGSKKYVIECHACDAILQFERVDVIRYTYADPRSSEFVIDEFIRCPVCSQIVRIEGNLSDYETKEDV